MNPRAVIGTGAWALAGLLWAFSAAAILTVGVFAIPPAALATWLTVRHAGTRLIGAALCGAALLPGYIALLNREGPGTVCHSDATPQTCSDQLSPWPWAFAAVLLFGIGVAVVRHALRRW